MPGLRSSSKASSFTESVIREMTRLSNLHGAVNLGQGFPDFPAPQELKDAAARAIAEDHNQYPITWGVPAFRDAIAAEYRRAYAMDIDPATEICVTCGSTEAVMASFLGLLDPGDEVILFEPFYEAYGPDSILAGATRRFVTLRPPAWSFDPDALRAAFGPATRAIVVNSPHNPTGKVFTREELGLIAELCVEHDVIAITDEIYEHITYEGREHVPIATLPGMRERTVTVSALSKTYSVTGWRVGWAIAAPALMKGIRATHDFMTVGAATPLQHAGVTALGLGEDYFASMRADYEARRALMMQILEAAGFAAVAPEGAYYVMADVSSLGFADDTAAAMHLVREMGVAAVPGSSFFSNADLGKHLLRFAFCKRLETLEAAGERLSRT
ncbi:MAG: aminotransferase class I/II-fold pyridoxal phosphate-dependent enzyme [Actinomycetota bacterium]